MAQARPFHSETSEEQLTDLSDRLARTRFPPALSGTDWTHVNLIGATPVLDQHSAPLTPAEEAFVAKAENFFTKEGAYAQIQGTRPATLAADCPTPPLAWPPGSWRSSAPGATAVATSSRCSARTRLRG